MRFSVFLSIHGLVLLWCASVAAFIVSTGVYRPGFKVNTLTSLPEQFLYPNSNKNCRYDRSRSQIKMEVFEGNPVGKKIWDMVWNLKINKYLQKPELIVIPFLSFINRNEK